MKTECELIENNKNTEISKKDHSRFFLSISKYGFFVSLLLILLYSYFLKFSIPFINYHAPLSEMYAYILISASTILLIPHVTNLKLSFWRIFLSTILNTESNVYKFFHHGLLIRGLSVFFSFILALHILAYFCTARLDSEQFLIILLGISFFYLFFHAKQINKTRNRILRSELNFIFRYYQSPFYASIVIASFSSAYILFSIYFGINTPPSFDNILDMSINSVSELDVTSRFMRIIVRHFYLLKVAQKMLLNIETIGKPLYMLVSVFSEGFFSIFSILLLFYPWPPKKASVQ